MPLIHVYYDAMLVRTHACNIITITIISIRHVQMPMIGCILIDLGYSSAYHY